MPSLVMVFLIIKSSAPYCFSFKTLLVVGEIDIYVGHYFVLENIFTNASFCRVLTLNVFANDFFTEIISCYYVKEERQRRCLSAIILSPGSQNHNIQ